MIKTRKKGEWFELIIPEKWHGLTIEQIFKDVWQAPKKLTHQLRMEKKVRLNGENANWVRPVAKKDVLQLNIFQEKDYGVIPSYMDISVLYEDEHILIVNKPPGINTHPNEQEEKDTLANGVAFYLQAKGEQCLVKHIHRLDRDTSGALLFAKHSLVGSILDKMLQDREIKRTYKAIVHGILKKKKGTIALPIGRDRHHPTKRKVSPKGQHAATHYETVKIDKGKGLSLVKCELETGRTHQIRVHLSHIGHPIAGDKLYGRGDKDGFSRLALHAEQLEFTHPFTGVKISCIAPFPMGKF